MYLEFIRGLN